MGIPTFTPNIPQALQSLGATQANINNNFGNYAGLIAVDHIGPNLSNQGQHGQVSLNTYGNFPYTIAGTQSFVGSYNASVAPPVVASQSNVGGSQLVYQPSAVNCFVPVSPRSLARVNYNSGSSTWVLGNGPYGANTNFNVASITTLTSQSFTYTFATPLPSTDYFVFIAKDVGPGSPGSTSKNGGISFNVSTNGVGSFSFVIMVY
jgi:hypothetical protein